MNHEKIDLCYKLPHLRPDRTLLLILFIIFFSFRRCNSSLLQQEQNIYRYKKCQYQEEFIRDTSNDNIWEELYVIN